MSDFTVIGLLGPAGSGKDLVADWFVDRGFVKVALADPMKRFVSKAFGVDWDRLWGPSEKRNELFDVDDTWWFNAIGNFGRAAEEIVQQVLTDDTRVNGYLKLHEWLTILRKTYPSKISARLILQTLGTEWGRAVDPIMWTRYAHVIIDGLKQGGLIRYRQQRGLITLDDGSDKLHPGVIISDHRFKNEIKYTQNQGGYVLRLRRMSLENTPAVGISGHQSEAEQKELSDEDFNVVFDFPEGVSKVHDLLETAFAEKLWTKGNTQIVRPS